MTQPDYTLGFSERGIVISETFAGTLRLAAFGPVPTARQMDREVVTVVRQALSQTLRGLVPREDANDDMERTARVVDQAVRDTFGDNREDARGTLVAACITDGWIRVAHTGHASALLVRDGEMQSLAPDPQKTTSEWHPFLGSRREGDELNPLLLHITLAPTRLQPGDRIVLSTAPTPHLLDYGTFVPLVTTGSPEMAAESLSDVLQVQQGLNDAGVAVLDWSVSEGREPAQEGEVDDALLHGLQDLISDLTDELDILPVTPPLAMPRQQGPELIEEALYGDTLIPDDDELPPPELPDPDELPPSDFPEPDELITDGPPSVEAFLDAPERSPAVAPDEPELPLIDPSFLDEPQDEATETFGPAEDVEQDIAPPALLEQTPPGTPFSMLTPSPVDDVGNTEPYAVLDAPMDLHDEVVVRHTDPEPITPPVPDTPPPARTPQPLLLGAAILSLVGVLIVVAVVAFAR